MAAEREATPAPALSCVADVDTRLACSACCFACPYYMRDRRVGERRETHRRTPHRCVLGRV